MIDWPTHACPNAMRVESLQSIIAVPYYYDQVDADATSPLNESYLLSHVGTDMKVSQWTVPVGAAARVTKNPLTSLGKGAKPPAPIGISNFRVILRQDDHDGNILMDSGNQNVSDRAVFKGNDNEIMNDLASQISLSEDKSNSILLWPDWRRKQASVSRTGNLHAAIYIDGYKPIELEFSYPVLRTNRIQRAFAQAGKNLRKRMLLKFPEDANAIKFYQTLRAQTTEGVAVYLTVSLKDDKNTYMIIKDIEVLLPLDSIKQEAKKAAGLSQEETSVLSKTLQNVDIDSIYCDTSKVEHMTGLTMALEYAATQIKAEMLQAPSNMPAFEEAAAIVRKHTRDMIEGKVNPEDGAPMHVNAAVYTAVNALQEMQTIDGLFDSFKGEERLRKEYTSALSRRAKQGPTPALMYAEPIIDNLISSLEKSRASKIGGMSVKSKKKQLNAWKKAIEDFQAGNTDRISAFAALLQKIEAAAV